MIGSKYRVHVTAALAALWLTACGGGGGDDVAQTPAAPAPAPAPGAPAPAPAPAPTLAIAVTANTQLAVNNSYDVTASTATPLTLTLPATATLNDTVSVKGTGTTPWVIAQAAGQSILTSTLNGNVAPGTTWTAPPTANLGPKVWHWVSSDATGQVLLASEASGGFLNTSRDGGVTWTTGNSPAGAGTWISSDMSADGGVMYAVQYQGAGMYRSLDRGTTWVQMTSPLFTTANLSFESITISRDGKRAATVSQGGNLLLSANADAATPTWTAATLPGAAQTYQWRSIDSSADGQVIVAVAQDPVVFISTNGGSTFRELTVNTGTAATPNNVFDSWYRVKTSADGKTIAIVGNSFGGAPGTGIYVSTDQGVTWKRGAPALNADYSALAMSDDGKKIVVSVSNANPATPPATPASTATGRVLQSTDSGATFTALTMPGTDTDWRTIAMSGDGNKLAAATGRFIGSTTGLLYTSLGNRTSVGTAGSVTGRQGANVTLKYLGSNQWSVSSSAGGPFTIK